MGGNVFSSAKPIKQEFIRPTLSIYLDELMRLFPQQKQVFDNYSVIGSAWKNDVSGDIDLAIDASLVMSDIPAWNISPNAVQRLFKVLRRRARTATDDMLMLRATLIEIARYINEYSLIIEVDVSRITPSSMFTMCPQFNSEFKVTNDDVQIDWMVGDPEWLKFSYHSEPYDDETVKGLHRTQLIVAICSIHGYTFSHGTGIKGKTTGHVFAKTPAEARGMIQMFINQPLSEHELCNYHFLLRAFKQGLSQDKYQKLIAEYLKILDHTRADIPTNLQWQWIERQSELGLTGKFLPESSELKKYTLEPAS